MNWVAPVPLAALLIADDEGHQPGSSLMPLMFGQTVPEFQARLAHAVGAGHIVLLAARLPAALIAGLDRLRADGIHVETVRDAGAAADHIHPDEHLLVIAGPFVPDGDELARLVSEARPCLWTSEAGHADVSMRIDAAEDWAGVALINGALLRETTAELGDWELVSTLLRRAIQAGVDRERQDPAGLQPIKSHVAAQSRAKQLLSAPRQIIPRTISDRPLSALARLMAPALLRIPDSFRSMDGAALGAAVAGFLAAAAGLSGIGLILLLSGSVLSAVSGRVAQLPLGTFRALGIYRRASPWLSGASLVAMGWHNSNWPNNLAPLLLSLWVASLLRPLPARHPAYSDAPAMLLISLLAVSAGSVAAGLLLCVVYSLASRLHAERHEESARRA